MNPPALATYIIFASLFFLWLLEGGRTLKSSFMELSKNSWHYHLHLVMWGRSSSEPTNLCPYFWKTIVLGSILFVPMYLFCLPLIIVGELWRGGEGPPKVKDNGLLSYFSGMSFAFNFVLLMLFSMVAMFFTDWSRKENFTPILGVLGWVIVLIIVIVILRNIYTEKKEYKRATGEVKEKRPNVVWEYIKAWYKRHCPMIKWK